MAAMKLSSMGLAAGLGLLYACAQTGSAPDRTEQPIELGLVQWERDFDVATARARRDSRDLLLLFQEVPG